MTSTFLNTIILLGLVQGFIISSLLFFSKKNRQSNCLLSVVILLMALASFNLYAQYKNCFDSPTLQFLSNFIPLVIVMPMGPLLYFYIQSSLDSNFKFTKRLRQHFYPVIIDVVPQLTAFIFIIGLLTGIFKNNQQPWTTFIDNCNVYSDIPRWMSLSFYVWLSAKYLAAFKAKRKGELNAQASKFKWLQQFIRIFSVFQIIWFAFLIPYVIPKFSNKLLDKFDWYPIYIPMAIMIYWLGIKGYAMSQADNIAVKKSTAVISGLSVTTVQQTVASLNKAMGDEKLYLNPNLNLNQLAEHISVTQKTISAVLNQHLNKSFNEFINAYRVECFKQKLLQPDMENFTIAAIATDCGFNSQATFQRTFKQITGMSPTEFRNSALQVQ